MQCVILAAGEGMRMRPLTENKPKPMLPVSGKPIIENIILSLPEEIIELIIVVGYKGEQIVEFCGENFHGKKVAYVWQKEKTGTAKALELCKPLLNGRFMLIFADDLHDTESLKKALTHDLCLLAFNHPTPEKFGVMSLHKDGTLESIIEKPKVPPTNLVWTGVAVLDPRIFNYQTEIHPNGEYFLPPQFSGMARDFTIHIEEEKNWFPIGYPEDLANAEKRIN